MAEDKSKVKEILAVEWRNAKDTIGIVAIKTLKGWKAYIGTAHGFSEPIDVQSIANHGAKLSKKEAGVFFPNLNIDEYVARGK